MVPVAGGTQNPAAGPAAGPGAGPTPPARDGQAGQPDSLAFTGIPTLGLVTIALTMLVIGGSVAYTARRRDDALLT